jgi:hypothetical protein
LEETLESFLENVKSGEVDEGQAEIWRKVMKVLPFNKGNTSKN